MVMLGVLLCDAHGIDPGLKADTTRDYRRIARAHGLVASRFVDDGPAVRLDYDSAAQVEAVAA